MILNVFLLVKDRVMCLGGSILTPTFHGYAPVQLTTSAMGPGQFYPPVIYWPYPSPPVSPTNYYARTLPPPPSALPPQQPQQQMVSE